MEEKTKDSTTDEQANQKEGTTSKLFPDLSVEPKKEVLPEKAPETKEVVAVEPKEEIKEMPTEYLDIQAFGDKKVKTKIDGIEMEIPFKDIVKGYQTDQYLTRKGQKIAEEGKKAKEVIVPVSVEDDEVYRNPVTEQLSIKVIELNNEIAGMKEREAGFSAEIAPMRYENAMTTIDAQLKKEGLVDFREKLPEIEKILLAMPPDIMAGYDNPAGFEYLYKNLKLQDFRKLQNVKPEPPVIGDVRPKPKIVPIESESSSSGIEDTNKIAREKDKKRATETGDWQPFMSKWG